MTPLTPRQLNSVPVYRDKKCTRCGRGYPITTLNIEGWVHHGEKLRCLNLKACQQTVQRAKIKEKKK